MADKGLIDAVTRLSVSCEQTNPAASCILAALAGALLDGSEHSLCQVVWPWVDGELRKLRAKRN